MNPSFLLFNACLSDGGVGCAFDLLPNRFGLLAKGTPAIMAECLETLEIPARAESWSIDAFCSPYFSNDLQAAPWNDRIRRAWRVTIRFAEPWSGPSPLRLGPYDIMAADSTWQYTDDISWSELPAVVIANFAISARSNVAGAVAANAVVAKLKHSLLVLHPRVQQLRVDLGVRRLPAEEPDIMNVLAECRKLGGAVEWQQSSLLDALA